MNSNIQIKIEGYYLYNNIVDMFNLTPVSQDSIDDAVVIGAYAQGAVFSLADVLTEMLMHMKGEG